MAKSPYPLPADPELYTCHDREGWLMMRRKGVGASEAADLMGEGYGSPVKLYADKTTASPAFDSQRFRLGLLLEAPILEAMPHEFGGDAKQWPANTLARCRDHPRMQCTPDGLYTMDTRDPDYRPGVGVAQVKTWSEFDRHAWDGDGPLVYQIQVQHELAVTGCQWGCLVVLIGATELRRIVIDRNERFIAALRLAVDAFWLSVETGVEPASDDSRATAEALLRLHPQDNGLAAPLGQSMGAALDSLARAKRVIKVAEARKRACENQIKQAIGDRTYGLLPDGRAVSWKTQDRAEHVVQASSFRVLRSHKKLPKGVELPTPEPRQIVAAK